MRMKFFILSLLLIMLLNGCITSEIASSSSDSASAVLQSSEPESHHSGASSETNTSSESANVNSELKNTSSKSENAPSSSAQTVISEPDDPSPTNSSSASKNTESPASSTPPADISSQSPVESEEPSSGSIWTPTVYATENDHAEIAKAVVKYINEYRASQGASPATQLPGLSEYAKYRSKQLVTNFAHDTNDVRAAATALKYGEYVDPSVHGLDGEPYYRPCAREAIGQFGKIGTIDEVAQHIANMFFNSSGHWSYVGSSEYSYIGIGITYTANRWYCDIAVSNENNG